MAIPFLNHITLNQNEARDFGMHLAESGDISSPVAGQLIFDNGTGQDIMKYYNGTEWISVGADTDNFVNEISLTDTTLTLGRTGTLADLTVDLGGIDTNDIDYVSNVTFSGNTLTFTGVGNAFDGTVDLSTLADTVREVSVDTNGDGNVNSTLEDSESLVLKKGDNITLTEADGVVTISSTDTVDMGSGFTVEADTNTNATTITEGETLTIAGGTNVTTETTADGTVTINSSFTNTDLLQNISEDNENADRFITTVANSTGAQEGLSHSTLKYNPSTETLSVTNLIISGTSTTVNTEIINLADNIITLNSNATGNPSENAGIEVERGDSTNVSLNWNETDDDWEFTAANHAATPAVVTYKIPRTFAATVGDGALTDIPVTHNLGTRQVIVQLYDTSSYETVYADVVRTDGNTVTLTFASAPATGDITVLISTAGV